ncbi:MAG: hypothetical protein IJ716_11910 [Lachnospiraceae bacterium]|nr:hypothetical protein [Lachnospiraceae bacterium]
MNQYVAVGAFGLISGLLAALADVPLVKPGKGSEQIPSRKPQAWWSEVPEKRFTISFWLSFLGQPGTYLTMWMLAVLIGERNPGLGLSLKINTFIGCYTGLLCHVVYCIKPLVYRGICKNLTEEEISDALGVVDKVSAAPIVIGFLSLWLGTTVIVTAAIIGGDLNVPAWCLLLNPIPSTIILLILKKCGIKIIGALGVGFMMFAILLIIAGMRIAV